MTQERFLYHFQLQTLLFARHHVLDFGLKLRLTGIQRLPLRALLLWAEVDVFVMNPFQLPKMAHPLQSP